MSDELGSRFATIMVQLEAERAEMSELEQARAADVDLRMEVDGIESSTDPFEWHVQPMIAIFDDDVPGRVRVVMTCSNPPTEAEIDAWVRGELDFPGDEQNW